MLLGGHAEAVRETMRHHLTLIDQFGQDGLISPTRLMIGRALLAFPKADIESAEAEFHLCLDCARNQGVKRIELLAATSLARLWKSQDRIQEARDLLTPVYDWFTEGFDTADLKDAKALLEELK